MLLPLLLALAAPPSAAAVPAEVAHAVALGDCPTVLAALPQPRDDDARLAAGWCMARQQRHAEAEATLAPINGPLAAYAALVRAEALVSAGKPDLAADVVQPALDLPAEAGRTARLLRGRALVGLGRSLEARDGLRALLDDPEVGVEARYWLAVGGEDRGERDAAIATFQRTWVIATTGPWSELAAERLAALGQSVPDLDTDAGRALAMERVAALKSANQHGEALELLRAVHARDSSVAGPITLGMAAFRGRDYPAALASWQTALGPPEAASGSPSALFDYALAHARTGDYDTAATVYRRVITLHPTSKEADQASYKLGYMAYDAGDDTAARALLELHIETYAQSDHYDEALWFAARAAWRTGDLDGAVRYFEWILDRREARSLLPGAAYWIARARGLQGDAVAERVGLDGVIARYPTSGYAWFAAQRTGRAFAAKPEASRPDWPDALAARDDVTRAEALLGAGFTTWARGELATVKGAAKTSGRAGALAAAHALIAAGDYNGGKSLAAPYCVKPWEDGDPVAQQACTPRPEAAIVREVASRYSLEPLLPFAIMNAESALKPDVTSIAGARGLMQLMPAEGARIHAELFEGDVAGRAFDADDLYSASYNAAMGTTELGMKATSLRGVLAEEDLPAVIASYNGGEAAVRRWLEAWEEPPSPDAFAEDVGYTETRRYVKRVLGFLMAYRWVYGDAP